MVKKAVSIIFVFLMLVVLSVPVFATVGEHRYLFDYADKLSDEEENTVSQLLDSAAEERNVELYIVTKSENPDFSAREYLSQFASGITSTASGGVIYAVFDYDSNTLAVVPTGNAEGGYDSSLLEDMISDFFSRVEIYNSCMTLASYIAADDPSGGINSIAVYDSKEKNDGTVYSLDSEHSEKTSVLKKELIVIAVALIGAVIICLILKKQMNTAVKNDSASEYMKPGSLKITSSAEMFIRSETDKTPRSKQNED